MWVYRLQHCKSNDPNYKEMSKICFVSENFVMKEVLTNIRHFDIKDVEDFLFTYEVSGLSSCWRCLAIYRLWVSVSILSDVFICIYICTSSL